MSENWQSVASLAALKKRAALLQQIRQFFAARQVLEVDTPVLGQFGVTDLHIDNLVTHHTKLNPEKPLKLYLQSSPEYAMKRLLAQYQTCIYQLGHVFRDDEIGRHHNPEFTLLEWYRVGFNMQQLIDEVVELLQSTVSAAAPLQVTYQQAFFDACGCDPLTKAGQTAIHQLLKARADTAEWMANETDTDTILQVAFSLMVESGFDPAVPTIVTHFPASQAALARLAEDDPRVAYRFEVYYQGIELANGYDELTSAEVQLERFQQDNQQRVNADKSPQAIDGRLIAALESGFPDCAGVALGFDRLLMIALGVEHIEQVLPFSIERC